MIDIKKVEEKIKLLEEGKILFMCHSCYGEYRVSMNQQMNRIVAVPYDDIAKKHEEKMSFVNKEGILKMSSESIVENIEKYIQFDGKNIVEYVVHERIQFTVHIADEDGETEYDEEYTYDSIKELLEEQPDYFDFKLITS